MISEVRKQSLRQMSSDYFNKDFEIAEIGSFSGTSTCILAKFVTIVHSIDLWDLLPLDTFEKDLKRFYKFNSMEEVYLEFLSVTKSLPVIPYRGHSLDVSKLFGDESLDAIYLDADHHYENVKSDLQAWIPKVKIGGIISGHDFYNADFNSCRVKDAVVDVLGSPLKVYEDSSWVFIKSW